jgi:hypothetical protein
MRYKHRAGLYRPRRARRADLELMMRVLGNRPAVESLAAL